MRKNNLKPLSLSSREWVLSEETFKKSKIQVNESLFMLGNGYLNLRGSLEENTKNSYRGMYLAGVFNQSESDVEELVKCPVWTDLSIWLEDEKFDVSTQKVLAHSQKLDLKKGILHRKARIKNSRGKIITLETKKAVFMHNVHYGYMQISIKPENFSGELKVFSGLNGDVYNKGFYPAEKIKHLNLVKIERAKEYKYLEMVTRDKKINIALGSYFDVCNPKLVYKKRNRIYGEKFTTEIIFEAHKKEKYAFENFAVIYTSREINHNEIHRKTMEELKNYVRKGVDVQLNQHIAAWKAKWQKADIKIIGDTLAQKGIRYNIYQLIINGNPLAATGIGAKFLSNEGYKGHSFWDTEIFILPFYMFTFPEIAKNLLMYRFHTLNGALENAKNLGLKGAKYAWESASTGLECTPPFAVNFDGTYIPIKTGEQEDHIVSDIVYTLYKFYLVTGDEGFIKNYGLEIIYQTARYWASRVTKVNDKYEIHEVIGPDEFHESVNNNYFTNYLVKWHLGIAVKLFSYIKKKDHNLIKVLFAQLKLDPHEINNWKKIADNIKLPATPENQIIEQFDGYFELKNIKAGKRDRFGQPVLPVGTNYKNIASTQLIKQADIVLLMWMFPNAFSKETKKKNYHYYEERTMYKSSLSHCAYALMGLEIGSRVHAYHFFMKSLLVDINDIHKNTKDGIHAASVGGSWQTAVQGFGGLRIKSGRLAFKPWLPRKWQGLVYSVIWKGRTINIELTHKTIKIFIHGAKDKFINVDIYDKTYKINTNKSVTYKY
ncbi:glycoside hydrolase family 65 protein [Candidatus Margulisiibacteriota bacterium]